MANALLNGSVIKIVNALSGVAIAAAGSSNAVNYAGYEGAMLIVSTGSAPAATGLLVNVERSATSDGTFGRFGASIQAAGTNNTVVTRSFSVNTSATWHKVHYTNGAGGSFIGNIEVLLHNARNEPVVSQSSNVTCLSDVLRG